MKPKSNGFVPIAPEVIARIRQKFKLKGAVSARGYNIEGGGEAILVTFDCRPPQPAKRYRLHVVLPDEVLATRIGKGSERGEVYEFKRNGKTVRTRPKMTVFEVVARYANDPRRCRKISKAYEEKWQTPEYRDQMLARLQSEGYRQAQSQVSLANWQDPDVARARIEGTRRAVTDPYYVEKLRQATTESWGNPEIRERRVSGLRRKLGTEEVRARMSVSAKAQWRRRNSELEELRAIAHRNAAEPAKRGRPQKPEHTKEYYRVGEQVEVLIPLDRKNDKAAVTKAREQVEKNRPEYEAGLVARYHKMYRQSRRRHPA